MIINKYLLNIYLLINFSINNSKPTGKPSNKALPLKAKPEFGKTTYELFCLEV